MVDVETPLALMYVNARMDFNIHQKVGSVWMSMNVQPMGMFVEAMEGVSILRGLTSVSVIQAILIPKALVLISMSAVTTDLLEEHWHIVAATLTVRTPWGHSTATVTLALRTGKQMRGALILMSALTHHGTIMLGKL